jgi:hypothetical protein
MEREVGVKRTVGEGVDMDGIGSGVGGSKIGVGDTTQFTIVLLK